MIAIDEQALICDLAEVYGIFDYKKYPVNLIGMLAYGLRENSRIKLKLCDQPVNNDTLLLAHIADRLGAMITDKKLYSFVESLCRDVKQEKKRVKGYETSEGFEEELRRIRRM